MKHNMYSIYDTASGLYSHPVYEQSDKAAIRSFSNISVASDSSVGMHPEDYTLFRLGTFDDQTGKLNDETNESLCTALECVAKSRKINHPQIDLLAEQLNGESLQPGGSI